MKTLFNDSDKNEIIARINSLTPTSKAQWGKMNVSQMLAHCSQAMKSGMGEIAVQRSFIVKLIGPLFKKSFLGAKPWQQNLPTATEFMIHDDRDFVKEKENLVLRIQQFQQGGASNASKHPHGFVGKVTQEDWGGIMYKHQDHHLRQFGA